MFCNIYARRIQLAQSIMNDMISNRFYISFNKSTKVQDFVTMRQRVRNVKRMFTSSRENSFTVLWNWQVVWVTPTLFRRFASSRVVFDWMERYVTLSTPPYFSYTVLTFSKDTFTWIRVPSKSLLTSNKLIESKKRSAKQMHLLILNLARRK